MNSLPNGWKETTIAKLVELAQGVAINTKTNHVLCGELKLPISKYILFSKSGFTEDLKKHTEENENIVLIENIL